MANQPWAPGWSPQLPQDSLSWSDRPLYLIYQPTWRDGMRMQSPRHPDLYEEGQGEFADDGRGDLLGILQARGYLEYLGVGGIGTGPVNRYNHDSKDGPYSPTDHLAVDARCGNERVLQALTSDFQAAGIRVWGDFVGAHLDFQHELFQQALRDPDGPAGQMFYLLRPDELPEYEGLSSVFIDDHPKPFRWIPEIGRWMVHRFYDDQPALNVNNPAVRELSWKAHQQMLGKWGFRAAREDACMYGDSSPGTTGEHQQGALDAAHWLRTKVDAEFSGCVLAAEAAGQRAVVGQWLRGRRAHMAWDFEFPARVFYAVATRDWRPLQSLVRESAIDEDSRWGTLLRGWDELQLAYSDDEIRETLFATLGVNGRYRTHRGLKQRLADLVPSEDAHVMLLGLNFCWDSLPCLYAGDEVGARGRREAPERWASRNSFSWDPLHRNAAFSRARRLAYPLSPDWRERSVRTQMGNPRSILERVRRLIMLRNRLVALQRGRHVEIDSSQPEVYCFARVDDGTRSNAPRSAAICVFNIAPYPVTTELDLRRWGSSRLAEYVMDPEAYASTDQDLLCKEIPWIGWGHHVLEVPPHGMRVLVPLTP